MNCLHCKTPISADAPRKMCDKCKSLPSNHRPNFHTMLNKWKSHGLPVNHEFERACFCGICGDPEEKVPTEMLACVV